MLKKELKALRDHCFDIEVTLPMFITFGDNDLKQSLRRELYAIRYRIGQLEVLYGDINEKEV